MTRFLFRPSILAMLAFSTGIEASTLDCADVYNKNLEYCWYSSHFSAGSLSRSVFEECDKRIKPISFAAPNGQAQEIERADFSDVESCTRSKLDEMRGTYSRQFQRVDCAQHISAFNTYLNTYLGSMNLAAVLDNRLEKHALILAELAKIVNDYRDAVLDQDGIIVFEEKEKSLLTNFYQALAQDSLLTSVIQRKIDALNDISQEHKKLDAMLTEKSCTSLDGYVSFQMTANRLALLSGEYDKSKKSLLKVDDDHRKLVLGALERVEWHLKVNLNNANLKSSGDLIKAINALFELEERIPGLLSFYRTRSAQIQEYLTNYAPLTASRYYLMAASQLPEKEKAIDWGTLPGETAAEFKALINQERSKLISYDVTIRGYLGRALAYANERKRRANLWINRNPGLTADSSCFRQALSISKASDDEAFTLRHESDYLDFKKYCK